MIREIALIEVLPGQEEAFEVAVHAAFPAFLAAEGCHGVELLRSIEYGSRYRLVVLWETVEHHVVLFRASSGFARWRELASPYFASPPVVEHVRVVESGADGRPAS